MLIYSDITVIIPGLITVIFCWSHVTADCIRRPTRKLIQRPNCIPKPIMNFKCVGSCDSSEESNFTCTVSRFRLGTVRLRCLNQDRVFENRRLSVVIPLECSCGTSDNSDNVMADSIRDRSSGTRRDSHTRRQEHRRTRRPWRRRLANFLTSNT